jgi:WD40 repeat protein
MMMDTQSSFKDCICVITGALKSVLTLATFGSEFFYGSYDGAVRSFDLKSGKRTQVYRGHNSIITHIVINTQSQILYSASHDGDIRFWQLGEDGGCIRTVTSPPMTDEPKSKVNDNPINCLAISESRGILASDRLDGTVLIWSIETGDILKAYAGHASVITCILIEDNHLYTGSRDSFVKAVDLDTDQIVAVFKPSKSPVKAICVGGNYVYLGCKNGNIYVYDIRQPSQVEKVLRGHTEAVLSLKLYDEYLLSGSEDTFMIMWNVAENKIVHVFAGHTDAVSCISITPDNEVYTGSYDCSIRKWAVAGVLQNIENERIMIQAETAQAEAAKQRKNKKRSPSLTSARSKTPRTPTSKTPKTPKTDMNSARSTSSKKGSLSKQNSTKSISSDKDGRKTPPSTRQ